MMIDALGPHAAYIIASYCVAALVIVGLVIFTMVDHVRLKRQLKALEGRGLVRSRSEP